MLEPVFDFLAGLRDELTPWVIIDAFEGGVLLRLGKYKKTLGPGFHWRLPFVDDAVTQITNWIQLNIPCQTLTTQDGKAVNISYTVDYRIVDAKPAILELCDVREKIGQTVVRLVAQAVFENVWEDCLILDLSGSIRDDLAEIMAPLGVEIAEDGGSFRDFSQARSIRHFQEHLNHSSWNTEGRE